MAKKASTSKKWLKEHVDDAYVQQAQLDGYRSRAVYKLKEIDEKDHLIKPGMAVVDLGAAPGSWCQYAASRIGAKGIVIGLDLLPIDSLANVDFIQGDFTENEIYEELIKKLDGRPVDLVLSDIAPNMSGLNAIDQPRSMYLCELAVDFAQETLTSGGDLLMKVFQGEGFDELLKLLRQRFSKVISRKPKASRDRSREIYLLAKAARR